MVLHGFCYLCYVGWLVGAAAIHNWLVGFSGTQGMVFELGDSFVYEMTVFSVTLLCYWLGNLLDLVLGNGICTLLCLCFTRSL